MVGMISCVVLRFPMGANRRADEEFLRKSFFPELHPIISLYSDLLRLIRQQASVWGGRT